MMRNMLCIFITSSGLSLILLNLSSSLTVSDGMANVWFASSHHNKGPVSNNACNLRDFPAPIGIPFVRFLKCCHLSHMLSITRRNHPPIILWFFHFRANWFLVSFVFILRMEPLQTIHLKEYRTLCPAA